MTATKNLFLDTSVILDGLENITKLSQSANIFISDVVLRELDGNKGTEGSKGYNAREFFRQLNKHGFKKLDSLPLTGKAVEKNDTLTEGSIDSGAHVYTLSRKWYRAKDINDSRIIEMAKDYDLTLQTLDQAQSVRAKSVGVNAHTFKKGNIMSYNEFNNTSYTVKEPNLKAIAVLFIGIAFGLPLIVLTKFSAWAIIPVILVIAIGVLYSVASDDSTVEFVENKDVSDSDQEDGFKFIKKDTGSAFKVSAFNYESTHTYAGAHSSLGQ